MAIYKLSEMSVPELNSTADLQRALNQVAQTGGTLIWDQPVQLTGDRGVNYTSSRDLTVEFVGRGMIDATQLAGSLASREAILFSGEWCGSADLTQNLAEGTRYVSLSPRQVSLMKPNAQNAVVIAANNGRFGIRSGELVPVTDVEVVDGATRARLAWRTRDTHLVGGANAVSLWLLQTPKIVVRGLKLYRNPAPQTISDDAARLGLYLRYVRDFEISDSYVYGCKYQSYLVLYGNNGIVRNCVADYGPGAAGINSLTYGFGIGPANNVTLDNCRSRSRSTFSTVGNQASYGIVARQCVFDATDEPTLFHAVRLHASTNDMTFENCVIRGGLSNVARNLYVKRCTIDGDMPRAIPGIEVSPQISHVEQVAIEDTVIQGGYAGGIYISGMVPEVTFDTVRISGCRLVFGRDKGLRGIRISPSYGHVNIRHLAMTDNYIEYPANWPIELSHTGERRLRVSSLTMSGVVNKPTAGGAVARLEADGVRKVVDQTLWLHAGQVASPPVVTSPTV